MSNIKNTSGCHTARRNARRGARSVRAGCATR